MYLLLFVLSCRYLDLVIWSTEGFLRCSMSAEHRGKEQGIKESSRDQSPFERTGEPHSAHIHPSCVII